MKYIEKRKHKLSSTYRVTVKRKGFGIFLKTLSPIFLTLSPLLLFTKNI